MLLITVVIETVVMLRLMTPHTHQEGMTRLIVYIIQVFRESRAGQASEEIQNGLRE